VRTTVDTRQYERKNDEDREQVEEGQHRETGIREVVHRGQKETQGLEQRGGEGGENEGYRQESKTGSDKERTRRGRGRHRTSPTGSAHSTPYDPCTHCVVFSALLARFIVE
jgi:hypothetical protein